MSTLSQFLTGASTIYGSAALGTNVFDLKCYLESNGGNVICKAGGTAWIVSPAQTEVGRTWYLRNDAVVCSVDYTKHAGWFVPTSGQLQNPGYCCRSFWDKFSSTSYWSSTENDAAFACAVFFTTGTASSNTKGTTTCVRAFRCVTY
jgi:hypothetical protein